MAILSNSGILGFLSSAEKKIQDEIVNGKLQKVVKYVTNFLTGDTGWCINNNGDAEFKSIYVRDKITTNEFVYNRIRVTEDEEIITSNGKIEEAEENGNDCYTISLDLREGDTNPFAEGDLLIGYYHSPGKSGEIYSIQKFTVTSDPSKVDQSMQVKADYKSYPHKHMIIVRVGNNNNEDRRAFIKISSRTNCQYFYDGIDSWTAFDDPNNVKCVLGKAQSGLIPSWAQGIVGIGKKWFGLIADGVILKGTFILRDEQQNKDRNLLTEIKAIPGMITTTISSAKIEGVNWMKRSSCLMKERTSAVFADRYRPMAVNSDIYGMHMLIDAFAKVEGKGDYCWYVTPTSNADPTVWSPLYNNWGGFASSYPAYGSKNFVAEYNDFYTLSFDYYFAGTVGDIKVGAKFYWGFKIDDNPDVNYYADFSLDISTGKWHHCELTVDLRKYKSSVFDKYDKIYFQLRTISGGGYLSPTWRMYHKNIQLQKGQKATEWSPSEEDLKDAVNESKQIAEHAKENAERANQDISIMVDDNILTSTEKKKLMPEWESIKEEKDGIVTNAGAYSISSEAYEKASTALCDYVNPYMIDLNSNSTIDGDTFRTYFSSYYQSRQNILNEIAVAAKTFTTDYTYSKTETDDKFTQKMTAVNDEFAKYSTIEQTAEKISLTVDKMEIGDQNFVINGDFRRIYKLDNPEWNVGLNGKYAAYDWSTGYNAGVPEPDKGYHVHITDWIQGYILVFPNYNSEIDQPGRRLEIMQTISGLDAILFKGNEYTISMDIGCSEVGQQIRFGLKLTPDDGSIQDFYDGLCTFNLDDVKYTEGMYRIQHTFKSTGTFGRYDLYISGHHGKEGTIFVKNISLQKGNKGYWTPSRKDLGNDTADVLLPTGIDIENKKITLTADKTEIRDNSGNVMFKLFKADGTLNDSVLDIAGVIRSNGLNVNDNFVIDRSGRFSSKDGSIEGKIKATSGDIGFLKLENGNLIGYENGVKRVAFMNTNIPSLDDLYDGRVSLLKTSDFTLPQFVNAISDHIGDDNEDTKFQHGSYKINGGSDYDQCIWMHEEFRYNDPGKVVYRIQFTLQEPGFVSFEIENTISDSKAEISNRVQLCKDYSLNAYIGDVSTGKEFLLEKGIYYLSVELGYYSGLLPTSQVTEVKVGVNINRVNFRQILACSIIGKNGLISRWGASKYLYFNDEQGFEVMSGSYGLKVNDSGIYKKQGSNWVPL